MCENYVQFKSQHHKVLLEHSHAHLFTLLSITAFLYNSKTNHDSCH